MTTVRERRVEQEWAILDALAAANPGVVERGARRTEPDADVFAITLHDTPGLVLVDGLPALTHRHDAVIYFRQWFPSVPIEVSVARPVVHPNVHPETGFVCLWGRFSPGDTVIEAVAQLQRVITWQRWNDLAVHVMQPDAHERVREAWAGRLPLSTARIAVPREVQAVRTLGARPSRYMRRRLS